MRKRHSKHQKSQVKTVYFSSKTWGVLKGELEGKMKGKVAVISKMAMVMHYCENYTPRSVKT